MSDSIRELIDAAAECYDIPQSMVDEALAEVERLQVELDRFIQAHSTALTAQMRLAEENERLLQENKAGMDVLAVSEMKVRRLQRDERDFQQLEAEVERLRDEKDECTAYLTGEVADNKRLRDEVERLRQENEEWRRGLEAIAGGEAILPEPGAGWMNRAAKLQRLARQTLERSE